MIKLQNRFKGTPSASQNRRLRVAWLHDTARQIGGCESYICRTQRHLEDHDVESVLLYGENGGGPLDMLPSFRKAFPIVDLARQLAVIRPDVIYAHRIDGSETLQTLADSGLPTLRFFHDHRLFCPREHKYTVWGARTCSKTIGSNCYRCMGVITRSANWPGVRLRTVHSLRTEQQAHHSLTGFVVASEYMRQHLIDHGFESSKIHNIPLYVNSTASKQLPVRLEDELLFVGQVVRGKGLDTLINAMAFVDKRTKLTVVGTGVQQLASQELASQLGLADRIRFVGQKDRKELNELFRSATALVVPSRSPETFGLVGIEAMSHGLPVIASDVGGIREWLMPESTGLLFEPNDTGSLANAISRLTSDSELRSRLSNQSRKDFLNRFTPIHHIDPLLNLLRQTASAGGCNGTD